ncbi:MAG: hypothetical protein KDA59_01570 [Planctomycetales bacterium]|nr:hypothetical protein [Planctomycetales bacterium]MCA9201703.1 hypothetical protein [Planctomycetales bacterium]MCA9220699.1 hypothetical protein [Planctomycetales bacterium]
MPADIQTVGSCSQCSGQSVTCKHNHFEAGELTIDSWEHKCPDCGWRATTAYRSDDEDAPAADLNPRICPYCSRTGEG